MADLYRIVSDCTTPDGASHTRGERLHLSRDNVLVRAGVAVPVKDRAGLVNEAPAKDRTVPKATPAAAEATAPPAKPARKRKPAAEGGA